jgi:hypothetical protein
VNLYRTHRDNGAIEPWLQENEYVIEINLDWNQFLIGGSYSKGLWVVNAGPLIFIKYKNWKT